jgi:hypothetical protein
MDAVARCLRDTGDRVDELVGAVEANLQAYVFAAVHGTDELAGDPVVRQS